VRAKRISIALIAGSIAVLAWVQWSRSQRPVQSDNIVAQWTDLDGESWLLPNLRGVTVTHPDRPHSFQEVHAWRKGEYHQLNRVRSYELTTNSDRMRGPEVGAKGPGVTRIIALGDSVTHGWGVADADTYPNQLADRLRREGHDVEILNAGVPSNTDVAMQRWCVRKAPAFKPDIVIWTRRVHQQGPNPHGTYNQGVKACKQSTGAEVIVVLPPVSTFDVRGSQNWSQESARVKSDLKAVASSIIEMTPLFRAAQAGRGVVLETRGLKLAVVDQTTGVPMIEVPPLRRDLPHEIYALFEANPQIREPLFFDDGHPDEEGFGVFADALVEPVAALIQK
jgi:hypothetical protein